MKKSTIAELFFVLFVATLGSQMVWSCCSPNPVMVESRSDEFDEHLFNEILAGLVEKAPLDHPCTVRVRELDPAYWGLTSKDPFTQEYLIEIESRQSMTGSIDTLIHEWAHAMTWSSTPCGQMPHGPIWGVAYAAAYNIALEHYHGSPNNLFEVLIEK